MRQRWYYGFAVKAAAFLLLIALLVGAGVGAAGVIFCGEAGFYTSNQPIFADSRQARLVCEEYANMAGGYLIDMFDRQLDGRGTTLAEENDLNSLRQRLDPENSNLKIVVEFPQNEVRRDFTDFLALQDTRKTEDWELIWTYYMYCGDDWSEQELRDLGFELSRGPLEIMLYCYLDPMMPAVDEIAHAQHKFVEMGRYAYPALAGLILCTLLGIADWVFLMCAMGHRPDVDKDVIALRFIDKIPYDL